MPAQEGPDDENSTRLSISTTSNGPPTNDEVSKKTTDSTQDPGATESISDASVRTVAQVSRAIGRWISSSEELKAIVDILRNGLEVIFETD
jgi:hypothetical protein